MEAMTARINLPRNLQSTRTFLPSKMKRAAKGCHPTRGQEARGEYIFLCDADLSMPIEEITRFIPPALPNVDVAIASREAPGAVRINEPYYRHITGRVFNTLIRYAGAANPAGYTVWIQVHPCRGGAAISSPIRR
jgi:hypothetical protein